MKYQLIIVSLNELLNNTNKIKYGKLSGFNLWSGCKNIQGRNRIESIEIPVFKYE
jgi:hypothetical protein